MRKTCWESHRLLSPHHGIQIPTTTYLDPKNHNSRVVSPKLPTMKYCHASAGTGGGGGGHASTHAQTTFIRFVCNIVDNSGVMHTFTLCVL